MSGSKPVALVIGASRGIGRQIAVDLAKSNYAGEKPERSVQGFMKSLSILMQ